MSLIRAWATTCCTRLKRGSSKRTQIQQDRSDWTLLWRDCFLWQQINLAEGVGIFSHFWKSWQSLWFVDLQDADFYRAHLQCQNICSCQLCFEEMGSQNYLDNWESKCSKHLFSNVSFKFVSFLISFWLNLRKKERKKIPYNEGALLKDIIWLNLRVLP